MYIKNIFTLFKTNILKTRRLYTNESVALPLRSRKPKSSRTKVEGFIDLINIQAEGGKGGDGCISFMSLFSNANAGPDGGDGGSGGHVIIEACPNTYGFNHLNPKIRGDSGVDGANTHRHGKNAFHTIIKVPIGTIIKNSDGALVGDLSDNGSKFILARGGAGGKGNHYFISSTNQTPTVAEYGANGENLTYTLELRSMAHFGLLGFPNAGKSTLLQAISRARPKIAPYPFTTKQPHLGMIKYSDYEQICVADLPGLIEGSHQNRGLGIQFLQHVERCKALIMLVDVSHNPWLHVEKLRYEIKQFSLKLSDRPQLIVANKIDLPDSDVNLNKLKTHFKDDEVIPVSAKCGTNLSYLLERLRIIYDKNNK